MALRAAVRLVDVTPPVGVALAGYGDRGSSTGVIGPIEAGLLAMCCDDGVGWVVVTLDAVGIGREAATRLRERVGAAFGWSRDVVMVSCTHNHAGPDWFDDADPSEIERMTNLVVAAASGLRQELTPVTVSVAAGETGVAVNRRELDADGRAAMGTNEDGHRDTRVTTLVPRRVGGCVLATLTVAALHGNCLKGDNTCLAPDFVGPFRVAVRESTSAPALFVQGCAGDLNPRWRGGMAEAELTGRTLARDVLVTLDHADPLAPQIAAASISIDVPMAPRPSALRHRAWRLRDRMDARGVWPRHRDAPTDGSPRGRSGHRCLLGRARQNTRWVRRAGRTVEAATPGVASPEDARGSITRYAVPYSERAMPESEASGADALCADGITRRALPRPAGGYTEG